MCSPQKLMLGTGVSPACKIGLWQHLVLLLLHSLSTVTSLLIHSAKLYTEGEKRV